MINCNYHSHSYAFSQSKTQDNYINLLISFHNNIFLDKMLLTISRFRCIISFKFNHVAKIFQGR